MERETGFEPATLSLEGWRSSQLSYSRLTFHIVLGSFVDWKNFANAMKSVQYLSRTLEMMLLSVILWSTRNCLILLFQFLSQDMQNGGEGRIRTSEGWAGRFTVCSLWPLGNLSISPFLEPAKGIEPPTHWLQISCSAIWATLAFEL